MCAMPHSYVCHDSIVQVPETASYHTPPHPAPARCADVWPALAAVVANISAATSVPALQRATARWWLVCVYLCVVYVAVIGNMSVDNICACVVYICIY